MTRLLHPSILLFAVLCGCGAAPRRAPLFPRELGYLPAAPGFLCRTQIVAGYPDLDCLVGVDGAIPDTLPLVVALHGRGDMPQVPTRVYGGLHHPFRFVMPQAPLPLEGGYSWFSVRVAEHQEETLAREVASQTEGLADLLRALSSSEPRPSRVIVAGFSQGGILAYALATSHPELMDVAFPMAGWLPPALVPERAPPDAVAIIAMHGSADERIPLGPTRELADLLSARGFPVEFQVFEGAGHALSDPWETVLSSQLDQALAGALDR